MKQEVIAAIVMCVMGFFLLFAPSNKIWSVTEKWKTEGGQGPSRSFVIITSLLGIVFAVAGVCLLVYGLK